ncbi:tyrosine-type recombinase/integrase [Microbulbifer sp.]|uniref:tyrosine-type recombinase/integrase n=1 Tax=Microbulbifer sp. TaxID=1908541 RepID=UPI003F3883A5
MALTDRQVLAAKPRASKYELTDDTRERGVGRLVVRVHPSGAKSFEYKYAWEGRRKYIQIGRHPSMRLADAREAIRPLAAQVKAGIDPKEELEREHREKAETARREASRGDLEQLFRAYTAHMKKNDKRTHQAVLYSLEKEVYPVIDKSTKAKDVTRDDVKQVLARMIQRGAATQSNRVRSYLMAAFNYALKHDNDPASEAGGVTFAVEHNPVVGIPKQTSAERVGDNHLTLDQVRILLAEFVHTPKVGETVAALLKLCFYTGGQRPYELAASRWESVNWEEKTLLITADISKNKREHLVPLTKSAMVMLRDMHSRAADNRFIFPHGHDKTRHIRTDSLAQAIARFRAAHPEFAGFIPRDIRRTCKTLLGELGVSKLIRDILQNHALQDVSAKHYDRYSYLREKRGALDKWERRLSGVRDNVIEMEVTA